MLKPTPAPVYRYICWVPTTCAGPCCGGAQGQLSGNQSDSWAGVLTHPHCYTVFADTVAIEGGGTQEALGSRGLMGNGGAPDRRYIWNNLVLVTPYGRSKSSGGLVKGTDSLVTFPPHPVVILSWSWVRPGIFDKCLW